VAQPLIFYCRILTKVAPGSEARPIGYPPRQIQDGCEPWFSRRRASAAAIEMSFDRWPRSSRYSGDSWIFLGRDFVNRAEVLLQN